MPVNKRNILFNGGRKIKLSTTTNAGNEGIKMTPNAQGGWNVNINFVISKDEADVFRYVDLLSRVPQGATFEEAFPNMIYFEALDDTGKSVFVKAGANSEFLPSFDKDLGGSINIKLNIGTLGKTQNGKTQNVVVGDH